MVYNWEPYHDECYRIFIEEGKSVKEVQRYMKEKYNFEPSKRGFEVQFKRWRFPSKRATDDTIDLIANRVKELWESNTSRATMMRVLHEEGYRISDQQLHRIRRSRGWLMRGGKAYAEDPKDSGEPIVEDGDDTDDDGDGHVEQGEPAVQNVMQYPLPPLDNQYAQFVDPNLAYAMQPGSHNAPTLTAYSLPQDVAVTPIREDPAPSSKKRKRRELRENAENDPSMPQRYPSETTLDESKAFLHLNNEQYASVRSHFQSVCQQMGVDRKVTAAPGQWEAAKSRVVAEHAHLQREFYGPFNGVPQEQKKLALDAIAMSVTKAMRTAGKRMGTVNAKTVLGLNPSEAREVRAQFYEILVQDNFVSISHCGLPHWEGLKRQWRERNPRIQQALMDSLDNEKKRAFDRLAADVMKRYREHITKVNPALKVLRPGPGPGPLFTPHYSDPSTVNAQPRHKAAKLSTRQQTTGVNHDWNHRKNPYFPPSLPGGSLTRTRAECSHAEQRQRPPKPQPTEQPDPPPGSANSHRSRLQQQQMDEQRRKRSQQQAAPSQPEPQQTSTASPSEPHPSHSPDDQCQSASPSPFPQQSSTPPPPQPTIAPTRTPTAALFRLSPHSTLHSTKELWFAMLTSHTLSEVHDKATEQFNDIAGRTVGVSRVEGILQGDIGFPIESDGELEAYLGWMGGGRCVFVVTVESVVA